MTCKKRPKLERTFVADELQKTANVTIEVLDCNYVEATVEIMIRNASDYPSRKVFGERVWVHQLILLLALRMDLDAVEPVDLIGKIFMLR